MNGFLMIEKQRLKEEDRNKLDEIVGKLNSIIITDGVGLEPELKNLVFYLIACKTIGLTTDDYKIEINVTEGTVEEAIRFVSLKMFLENMNINFEYKVADVKVNYENIRDEMELVKGVLDRVSTMEKYMEIFKIIKVD